MRVLVLCTGNSCRSVMAEALFNHYGNGRITAVSAGSQPAGYVHPKSLETLRRHGIDPGTPRSKSWDEFATTSFNLVVTVCDSAAAESCPFFPGAPQKLGAEALGTALLVAVVVGSGIMAHNLSGGSAALALLGNTLATAAILPVLIIIFAPLSGAHFNPAVSLVFALRGALPVRTSLSYMAAQTAGGTAGTLLAHLMFGLDLFSLDGPARSGGGLWLSEIVAAFGLVLVILAALRHRRDVLPYLVGLYIAAGYWFTSSTCFANPAVTVARALTGTFAGINPAHAPAFIIAQIVGALLGLYVYRWLYEKQP